MSDRPRADERSGARPSAPRAAVGLAGKVLGPVGLAWLIVTGTWPVATVVIIVTNDLIWWLPFAVYLRDAWPAFRHPGDLRVDSQVSPRAATGSAATLDQ